MRTPQEEFDDYIYVARAALLDAFNMIQDDPDSSIVLSPERKNHLIQAARHLDLGRGEQ